MNKIDLTKTVVVEKGEDRREMVRTALTKLGSDFTERVKKAKKIFIHPNLVTHFRKAACTDVEAVRGVLDHLSLIRGDEILIGDASYHGTKRAFIKLGYPTLERSGKVKLVDLNDDETVDSYAYTAEMIRRPIPFSKHVAESDFNIVVVPAKMHGYYIVSLSVKTHIAGSQVVRRSPFGIHARWPWLHTGYKPAHMTLADVYTEHPAQLAVIDGTQAMEGNGPASGRSVDLGWLIASFNPVAADALAAYLMGLEPSDIGYLYFLDKKGLGPIDIKRMRIIGPDPETIRKKLSRPSSYPALLGWK